MKVNMKKSLLFAAMALCASTMPVQAQGTRVEPSSLYQSAAEQAEAQSQILPYGHTPQEVAEYERAEQEKLDRVGHLEEKGEDLLTEGHFAAAEADFREELAVEPAFGTPYAGLAEALDAQGRTQEAFQAYRELIFGRGRLSSTADETRTRMGYAIVLSQLGHWPEAVAVYEKELPNTTHFGDAPVIDVHFNPAIPMPAQLQALAHVASGMQYIGSGQSKRAFVHFYQALHLDSNSPFANYYYGYGWRSLDPTDKARLLNARQAKAAFRRAEKTGNADVKAAATKALKILG